MAILEGPIKNKLFKVEVESGSLQVIHIIKMESWSLFEIDKLIENIIFVVAQWP